MNIVKPAYPMFGTMQARKESAITDIIVHHSAGSLSQTPLDIDLEHRARGMAGIGYNYIIGPTGVVFSGRPANVIPAASYGRNAESLNICVIGNFHPSDSGYTGKPSGFQLLSIKDLLIFLHHQFPGVVRTISHRDVAKLFHPNNTGDYATACCGDQLYWELPHILDDVRKAILIV